MKLAVFALVCFLSTFVAADTEQEFIDFDKLHGLDLRVDPIGPANILRPGTRIVGGAIAPRNGFPYQVALIINQSDLCGASIISRKWVLTAAHCVETASSVQVIAGAHNPKATEPTQVRLSASSRIVHSQWDPSTFHNDIALVKVSSIPIGRTGISTVDLASASSGSFAGSTAVFTGWGQASDSSSDYPNGLKFIQLPVITNALCQASFGSRITSQHICTSGQGGHGACKGDSGGPLVINSIQVGIASFVATQCAGGHPSVFSRVSTYRQWIKDNAKI